MSFLLFESFFVYFLLEESKSAGLLADVGEDAAVNVEDQAVDKVGSLGSEEDSGAAQILGLAPALGRGLGNDELVKRMTAAVGLDLTQGCGLRGGDVAGSDAVALDVVLAVLGGNVLGQHLQAALGSSVGGDSLAAQLAHHGADVDDLAAALLDHIGNDSLGDDEGGVQVNVDDLTELGSGHLDHRDALDDTGVVDQHIDVADLGGDLLDHLIDGILVGDVADIAVGFDAGFLVGGQALVDQLLLDVVKDDLGAAVGHSGGNGKADAIGSAGDEGDLTGQVEGFRGANRHDAKPPKFVTVIYSGAHHWGARIKVNSCAYLAQAGAKYVRFLRSAQISCGDIIHIIELHVLAAHGPDKGVVRGADTAVDAPGAHSIELLPNNRVVVALSGDAGGFQVYDRDASNKVIFKEDQKGGHGVIWMENQQLLYALGYDKLLAYELKDWNTSTPSFVKKQEWNLPLGGTEQIPDGHDLIRISDHELGFTTAYNVYVLDTNTGTISEFEPMKGRKFIKSFNYDKESGYLVYTYADIEWWTHNIHIQNPNKTITISNVNLYKVRTVPERE